MVLYEDMMLIGEKTISIPKNRHDKVVLLEDVNKAIPESAVDCQMISMFAMSDKKTQAKLECNLQDQSPKDTDPISDEQKIADLISKHQAETGIKKQLINETNMLAFIDEANNLFYDIEYAYKNKYELNSKISIGDCEVVCSRNIINIPEKINY